MRPRGLTTIVDHFAEVLPRRAFDVATQSAILCDRSTAEAYGLHDASLPEALGKSGVNIRETTRACVLALLKEHGMDPEDSSTIDHLNAYFLSDNNPFMQPIQALLVACQDRVRGGVAGE